MKYQEEDSVYFSPIYSTTQILGTHLQLSMVVLIEGFQNHLADFLRQGVPNFLPLEKKIDLPKKWQIWGYLLSTTLTWKISPKRSIYFVFAQIELKKLFFKGLKMI